MPDWFRDEETECRTQSLCLFDNPGITSTSNRRCENCPGAARTPLYHQRRCPLDSLEHNLFSPTHAVEGKSEIDPKLLASSSKELQHDEDALDKVSNEIGDISLDGRTGRKSGRCSRLNSGIRSPSTDRSVSDPHFEIGVKRKAYRPESSLRIELADPQGDEESGITECMQNKHQKLIQDPQGTEALVECLNSLSIASNKVSAFHTHDDNHSGRDSSTPIPHGDSAIKLKRADISLNQPEGFFRNNCKGDQLDGRSDVKEYLQNKPQKKFRDIPQEVELHSRSWGSMPVSQSSLSNSLDASPEDCHSSFRIFTPGIGMITDEEGVRSCSDGIYDLKEDGLMSLMEIDEPCNEELLNERFSF